MGTTEKILSMLLREKEKTATEIAQQLKTTRQAVWKALNKLVKQKLILLRVVNSKKTSVKIIRLNFENILTKKTLSLILTKQAIENERWVDNFSKLEKYSQFIILFGSILTDSNKAKDIDLMIVSEKKNFKNIDKLLTEIQKTQSKKIHFILLTTEEFKIEIKIKNKAYIDAMKKGVVLFGQENFIEQMENLNGD